jgi:hypothetical protein
MLKWDTICLPKSSGGLDIRKTYLMNQAMLDNNTRDLCPPLTYWSLKF